MEVRKYTATAIALHWLIALAIIGMVAAAFNLIPVVVGAFMQEVIDVVSILWALTVLFDRGESA